MKKSDILVTIVFISILFLPSIFSILLKDKIDQTNYENRVLYQKPELSFQNIVSFPTEYENYYNDHIPFKNEIRKSRASVLYNLFKTSASERVIVGYDGWLFYNSIKSEGKTVDTVTDFRNITSYSLADKQQIKNSLEASNNFLKEKNIEFYLLVIPNKENVYSDYMPKSIHRNPSRSTSKTEEVLNYLKENSDISFVYPKQSLIENRTIAGTYCKYDTHWNSYGAYLTTLDLMKKIEPDFIVQDILFDEQDGDNDLANMNLMKDNLKQKEPKVSNFYSEIDYNCENIEKYQLCSSNQAIYEETVLIIGDSFRTALMNYLPKLYQKTLFVHNNAYNFTLIDKYQPDIVIFESVERYFDSLSNLDTFLTGV